MPETTHDAEMLEWRIEGGGEVRAASPFWDDEEPIDYVVVYDGTACLAALEGKTIAIGTLLSCIHACQEDADNARKEQGKA